MKVNKTYEGYWTLCAVEDYMQYNVSFNVKVYGKKNPDNMVSFFMITSEIEICNAMMTM